MQGAPEVKPFSPFDRPRGIQPLESMVPCQASPLGSDRLCSLADALPPVHWTRGASFCPHQCPSFPTPRTLEIVVHFASALSSLPNDSDICGQQIDQNHTVHRRTWVALSSVMEQKASAEQHANNECCLNPTALSCQDTHTQRRSGCSLQRACSPPPRFGGYGGTHDAAGCQHLSHTSFWKKAWEAEPAPSPVVPEGGLRKRV